MANTPTAKAFAARMTHCARTFKPASQNKPRVS